MDRWIPDWNDSKLIDFGEYELIIVPDSSYQVTYVFWKGGNRWSDMAKPSYEVKF